MRAGILVLTLALSACSSDSPDVDDPAPNDEPGAGCAIECHGADASNAPPKSLSGSIDTGTVGVGAHQSHAIAAPTWHRKVVCADCHVVPDTVDSPGHIDGDNKAELTFSDVAGPTTMWTGTTCSAFCHGKQEWGGAKLLPVWTQVDGTQATCGSCHGVPPPPPHPTEPNCAECHPTMEENSLTFRDPASHINGIVDLVDSSTTGGCTSCHGSTNAAPPKDLAGNTVRTAKGVGAHQQHLGPSTWHREIACSSCHVVPQTQAAPGHIDGDNIAEVKFDALNPTGVYTTATATCTNQYCHGNGRASNGTMSWLGTGPLVCGRCHSMTGQGMSGRHQLHIIDKNIPCEGCHRDVVMGSTTIINPLLHVDSAKQVKMQQGTYNPATNQCSNVGCHGPKNWTGNGGD